MKKPSLLKSLPASSVFRKAKRYPRTARCTSSAWMFAPAGSRSRLRARQAADVGKVRTCLFGAFGRNPRPSLPPYLAELFATAEDIIATAQGPAARLNSRMRVERVGYPLSELPGVAGRRRKPQVNPTSAGLDGASSIQSSGGTGHVLPASTDCPAYASVPILRRPWRRYVTSYDPVAKVFEKRQYRKAERAYRLMASSYQSAERQSIVRAICDAFK